MSFVECPKCRSLYYQTVTKCEYCLTELTTKMKTKKLSKEWQCSCGRLLPVGEKVFIIKGFQVCSDCKNKVY